MTRKTLFILAGLGMVAQALVPAWMLVKHHLILTQGEKVTIDVTYYDPRDLFMGHYVRLTVDGGLPAILEDVPQNYLRYYCDQRYAKAIDTEILRKHREAQLDVRVWRGTALAEELRICGLPAYEYLEKRDTPEVIRQQEEEMRIAESRPDFNTIVGLDSGCDYSDYQPHERFLVAGKNLTWNSSQPDEGFFFKADNAKLFLPCTILQTFKEGVSYVIQPQAPLDADTTYMLFLRFRQGDDPNLRQIRYWRSNTIKTNDPAS